MPLIKDGRITDDPWRALDDEAPLPERGPVIVSLARWRAERQALAARGEKLGIRLASDEAPEEIAADLDALALIALEFPKFTDGRAYSHARLLRERHGYGRELRAVGNVLADQALFMRRCGFDAFEVDDRAARRWQKALSEITHFYQPAADDRAPVSVLRHRRPAAE